MSFFLRKIHNNIYNSLVVKDQVGWQINITGEVQQLLGNNLVRAIIISTIDGLMWGIEVINKYSWWKYFRTNYFQLSWGTYW